LENVLLNGIFAARRPQSRARDDSTGPKATAEPAQRPGLALARRTDAALRGMAVRPARSLPSTPAARPVLRPAAVLRRLDAPERLVPILVAAFLLVASVTAVPGLADGARGATRGSGDAPRIAVGGDTVAPAAAEAFGANDGAGLVDPGIGFDETAASVVLGQQQSAGVPEVEGQFLEDGTLLKPVVVDTAIEDGSDRLQHYKVRSGDTLTGIASRHGVSMMTLWWANKLKSKDDLKVGQVLVIPPVNGLVVTVKSGDTLASIAGANSVDAARIVKVNGLSDETLVLGQVLIIPGARGEAYPTPKPTKRPAVRVATVSRPTAGHARSSSRSPRSGPSRYSGGRFAWPVAGGYISQYYHYGHPALDIAADYGTAIKAAAAGRVIFAGWKNNGGGYQVWISHGSGLFTTYNHMSSVAVSAGRGVGRGSFIGRMGASGWATGPHLHFEVWRGPIWSGGSRLNPLAFL
jgi:murein DD-endopeptidase MepM/ murein hydrolase activator NlpD